MGVFLMVMAASGVATWCGGKVYERCHKDFKVGPDVKKACAVLSDGQRVSAVTVDMDGGWVMHQGVSIRRATPAEIRAWQKAVAHFGAHLVERAVARDTDHLLAENGVLFEDANTEAAV